jgi:hypothetical protein
MADAWGSSRFRRQRSRVAPERVIGRNFHENDPDAVRVLEPHLDQSPGLDRGGSQNVNASPSQPLMLSMNVPHLEPDHHRVPGRARGAPGYLKQSRTEEEHHGGISRRTELPVNRQAQHVPVEATAPVQVGGPKQNPATQYVHDHHPGSQAGSPDTQCYFTSIDWACAPR